MARYVQPTASIDHIPQKPAVILGTVAYFDVFMQKVTQGNNEKVLSFATRLEETQKQIQLQCPSRRPAMEAEQHLKDCLFHGVHEHICNPVQYLYSAPDTSYSQFMAVARKAESKNEETQEKVRARYAVTSNLGDGMAELSQQISKLMTTLTQTRQGSSPPVPQNIAMGKGTVVGASPVTQLSQWQGWP